MDTIAIDGLDENAFRCSIEDMLRLNQVEDAVGKLRALLKPYAGEGRILPARFLEVTADDVEIAGWDRIPDRLYNHDKPGRPITAIGVTLADGRLLGGPGPSNGLMAPFIKTFYFSDEAYPFSEATRDDLLDGYSREGFEWQGDYQATDATLSIRGLDDLYGAIVELEGRLFDNPDPPEDEIRAGTIAACYVAALIHQALRMAIRSKGLPRPLCVLAGCDGVYPFFDAPVAGSDECKVGGQAEVIAAKAEPGEAEGGVAAVEEECEEAPFAEASILDLITRKVSKTPVLVVAEDEAREASRLTEMAGAERLGIENGDAFRRFLESAPVAEQVDPVPVGGIPVDLDAAWGAFDQPEIRAEPAEPPAMEDWPPEGVLPEPEPFEAAVPGTWTREAVPFELPRFKSTLPEPGPDPLEAEPLLPDAPTFPSFSGPPLSADVRDEPAEPVAGAWPDTVGEPPALADEPATDIPEQASEAFARNEFEPSWGAGEATPAAGEAALADDPLPFDVPTAQVGYDDTDAAEWMSAPPVRHSLRARIEMAHPEPEKTLWNSIKAALAGFMRLRR